jgi:hypothetical protein
MGRDAIPARYWQVLENPVLNRPGFELVGQAVGDLQFPVLCIGCPGEKQGSGPFLEPVSKCCYTPIRFRL